MSGNLPEPRIVRLIIDGETQHYATFSKAKLDNLKLGDLRPYPALDAAAMMKRITKEPTP